MNQCNGFHTAGQKRRTIMTNEERKIMEARVRMMAEIKKNPEKAKEMMKSLPKRPVQIIDERGPLEIVPSETLPQDDA